MSLKSSGGLLLAGSVALYLWKLVKSKDDKTIADDRTEVSIAPPDDFHLHLRDGEVLAHTVAHSAAQFARAIVMPNLKPPVVSTEQALAYRERILAALKESSPSANFTPLMTLYLTDKTTPAEIVKAKESGHVYACKLYPAGATTNSDSGVTNIKLVYPALREMAKQGILLLVHSEVTDPTVDIFDREAVFIARHLRPLIKAIPELKVVMEHVTTKDAVEFVKSCGPNVAATITAHHLLYNRNRIFKGGLNPHYYCLPVLKAEEHRCALVAAAASGSPKFFAGTDSAPHAQNTKHSACGCAGCYTAHAAVELYAEALANVGALRHLEGFLSKNGARFYQLPVNEGPKQRLVKKEWTVPATFPFGSTVVVPLRAGEKMAWGLSNTGLPSPLK